MPTFATVVGQDRVVDALGRSLGGVPQFRTEADDGRSKDREKPRRRRTGGTPTTSDEASRREAKSADGRNKGYPLEANHLAGAYLFVGPAGVGKATVAQALARTLVCELGDPERCAPCCACDRLERELHPDMIWLRPEGTFIKVEQIRELEVRLAAPPHEARARLIVIDPADQLHHSAQNALLKSLEEPPARSHFVLISAAPHRLLSTVLSRCQRLVFTPLQAVDIEHALEGRGFLDPATRATAAQLAQGSLGRALHLLEGEALAKQLQAVEALESAAQSGQATRVFETVAKLGNNRADVSSVLEILRDRLRDLATTSPPSLRHRYVSQALHVTKTLEALSANVNVALAVESLALS